MRRVWWNHSPWTIVIPILGRNWRRREVQICWLILIFSAGLLVRLHLSYIPEEFELEGDFNPTQPSVDISLGTAYLPLEWSPRSSPTNSREKQLKPSHGLPIACLDGYIAFGTECVIPQPALIDVLWTWVNGSDALLQSSKERVKNQFSPDDPYGPSKSWKQIRQFRDHDELKHSMRSVLENFRSYAGHFHLVAGDFAGINTTSLNERRWGQVPQWLNLSMTKGWKDGGIKLELIHHAQIFEPYNDTIFNSYAIESQFGNLRGVSEHFIYMNDDFFFTSPLTPRSFYTQAYGLVLRMESNLVVSPTQYGNNIKGDWRSLAKTNSLLSARFGSRYRPYVSHEAKSASVPLLHEVTQVWADAIADTAIHPFRETRSGVNDLNMMFMMTHFVVERWREALLWTWVIGRIGGLDDSWGEPEIQRAWTELGGETTSRKELLVHSSPRGTLNSRRISRVLENSGYRVVDGTKYVFSSDDGYPYSYLEDVGAQSWPHFDQDIPAEALPQCSISYTVCFLSTNNEPFTRASNVFTNIAFRWPGCGDCIISALVLASGSIGINAFLPEKSRIMPSLAGKVTPLEDVPHLPLVDRWDLGDFSLREVLQYNHGSNVREWTLRLLERYRFVIGETASHFAMLTSPSDTVAMIRALEKKPATALLCINDDVFQNEDKTSDILKSWLGQRWPQPAAWEKSRPPVF